MSEAKAIKKEPLIRIAKRAERSNREKLVLRLLSVLLAICAGGIFILILGKIRSFTTAKWLREHL